MTAANDELALASDDFRHLIDSLDIALILVDRTLHVRLLTSRAREAFDLVPADLGAPLTDLTNRIGADGLVDDVTGVLEHPRVVEREVPTRDGGWLLVRILPYRAHEDRIDGVVVTLQDITPRRDAELRMRNSEERLRLLIDGATDYAIFTMAEDGTVDSWNQGAQRVFGYSADEIVGRHMAILFTPEDRAAGVPDKELATCREKGSAADERWHLRKDGTRFYCHGVVTCLGLGSGIGFAKIARDLTAHREASLALERAHTELEERVQRRTAELKDEAERRGAAQERAMTLMRNLVTAQEDQRARLARDLHDSFGQQLTALRLVLEHHMSHCSASGGELERALAITAAIDAEIDFLAWELRPAALDDLGLAPALARFVREWSSHYGIEARFHAEGSVADLLTPEIEITCYRVAQEALNNVLKHAHARHVGVVLERRGQALVLVIEDDGVGFDPDDPPGDTGLGLIGMRERAALVGARLEIESSPGQGTTVFVRYPDEDAGGGIP